MTQTIFLKLLLLSFFLTILTSSYCPSGEAERIPAPDESTRINGMTISEAKNLYDF